MKDIYRKIILFILIFSMVLYGIFHINGFMNKKTEEMTVVNWVNLKVPSSSQLFTFEITGAVNKYCRVKPNEFYFYNPETLDKFITSGKGRIYFILPVEKLKSQWINHTIERTYEFLLNKYKPVLEGKVSYYSVLVIEGGVR